MTTYMFNGECDNSIKQAFIDSYGGGRLQFTVKTIDAEYASKSGIYSAERADSSKPIVINWGDGTVEQIYGDISQKVHEYTSVGTFNVVVKNIKSYTANITSDQWVYGQSNNANTLCNPIRFPNQISCISPYCFVHCLGIENISIPSSIKLIGEEAFGDTNISSLEFENGILSIDDLAFVANFGLKNVSIPDSVTYIGNIVFSDCHALSSISVGAGAQHFGSYVFENCSNLESIYVSPNNSYYKSEGGLMLTKDGTGLVACIQTSADMVIPSTVKRLPDGLFASNTNLTSIVLPPSVDYMGDALFAECYQLVNAVLPTNITSIKDSTFANCISLLSIDIPSTVQHIGDSSFANCISLSSINMPNSVESIAGGAFSNCWLLSSISCPATDIADIAFEYCVSIESATFTMLNADLVQDLIINSFIFEGINTTLGPDGYPTFEWYDKTVHISCSDSEFDAVFYADGTIEFVDSEIAK